MVNWEKMKWAEVRSRRRAEPSGCQETEEEEEGRREAQAFPWPLLAQRRKEKRRAQGALSNSLLPWTLHEAFVG